MKKNLLKLVLPAFAILLAVGLAFGSEERTDEYEGHYLDDFGVWRTIKVEPECHTGSLIACTYDGHQLYAEQSHTSQPLYKN